MVIWQKISYNWRLVNNFVMQKFHLNVSICSRFLQRAAYQPNEWIGFSGCCVISVGNIAPVLKLNKHQKKYSFKFSFGCRMQEKNQAHVGVVPTQKPVWAGMNWKSNEHTGAGSRNRTEDSLLQSERLLLHYLLPHELKSIIFYIYFLQILLTSFGQCIFLAMS